MRRKQGSLGAHEADILPSLSDSADLELLNVAPANTYLGKLSPDGTHWVVDESTRNVHVSEDNTRIIKMSEMDGEYVLLGRQTLDTANIFVQVRA